MFLHKHVSSPFKFLNKFTLGGFADTDFDGPLVYSQEVVKYVTELREGEPPLSNKG